MTDFPKDIFTEPAEVDPDTLANLGPLRRLAGEWEGRKGVDLNPQGRRTRATRVYRTYPVEPTDPQANGPQLFYGLRYHVRINTPDEDIAFHDQVGHWLWEPATGLVLQTLSIPRGQVAIAAGHAAEGDDQLVADRRARLDRIWHLLDGLPRTCDFRTDRYQLTLTFNSDGTWSYVSETTLEVRGQPQPFIHRDRNTLAKVAEPTAQSVDANPGGAKGRGGLNPATTRGRGSLVRNP